MKSTNTIVDKLKTYEWDYFVTLTYKRKVCDGEIQKMMNRFTQHPHITGWVWVREFTSLLYPHLHLLLKLSDMKKYHRVKHYLEEMGDVHFVKYDKTQEGVSYTLKTYGSHNDLWDMKQPPLSINQKLKLRYYEFNNR